MFKQWKTLYRWLRRYFHAYGGVAGVLGSPIFGVAVIVSALSYSIWLSPTWVDKVDSLIPSLLGFSLGTYAILFSLVSARLKGALRALKTGSGVTYLESINATFFHFIMVQVVTLVWATLFKGSWFFDALNFFGRDADWVSSVKWWAYRGGAFGGFVLLTYSILLTIAAALAVYRLAMIKDPKEDDAAEKK
ncbi:hypothetical protein [Agrobacterium tumefaciens]|uniref:Uncharacterized protein n=1 Tax=Agrobacterium tumefaciens TaxID=358 RepID=A0AA44F7H8_AGRTU|nr:hypothetical protein [Agrobacterium tumefaciens]NSL24925.1 hypothetical protein [Agrobacterium tumefaciens]NTB86580.1 hypothetical protein [Agrobacterium tumefaciens]NTC20908.1 hypothetical protein [Agrobacterium tumefaciens]NTC30457.1 hypothetical protein [Agrobacterium tumefaciens]NTC54095.1 hypothetical protein [Agrobacterium tumefaciens]